jgi:hypothetical protein
MPIIKKSIMICSKNSKSIMSPFKLKPGALMIRAYVATRVKPAIISGFLFFSVFFSYPVFAWNQIGHELVANIAYQNLEPATRAKIDDMVTRLHAEYPNMDSYLQMAIWPDELRKQKIETYTHWHYINYSFSNDGTTLPNLLDTDNAIWALKMIEVIVKNNHANPYERARFLAFFTHIVGDLHQPLHAVTLISQVHPDGDRGGNSYAVLYQSKKINLHKLWDEGLTMFAGESSPERISQLTQTITTLYPEKYFGDKINNLTPDDWASENLAIAKQYVYNTTENQPVSAEYIESGQKIAEQNVALAGYRLARLLNQLL